MEIRGLSLIYEWVTYNLLIVFYFAYMNDIVFMLRLYTNKGVSQNSSGTTLPNFTSSNIQ
jgi:hypothetical protein